MTKAVIPRILANKDIEEIIDYYLAEQAEQAALGFIDALEKAYACLSSHPASGISRYAHELSIPGLSCWPLRRYPYLVFYMEREDHIDVWRVLHGRYDIPERVMERFCGPDFQLS
ncbi:type II toxin-antitoxin system RelE/ParE family toxin [Pseudomonas sp. 21LCFQ02]|uniref:type II toxin-antitoxin system RelE/ParE family toxin n=1 Tax=unclassified Pseudomonas TaxID=196821 RepID=UPI0004F8A4C4|nr:MULTISPECIES: type II toxin-antitoxin system RelE/ParE family toxin [unclassified Pseudomonas]MCO8171798.1 type II toxin-antitoxin system RelE/ParE family toxin [Pseudomonas sp. 21LCFQ02]BAP43206.1 RelE/ParE family plasmid stabilization system protein [Pseudomonas sp. StFLB209]